MATPLDPTSRDARTVATVGPGAAPAPLDPRREGRRFAFTLAPALALLAGLLLWRGRGAGASVLGSVAAVLLLAGVAAPAALDPVRRAWLAVGLRIGRVTTPVILGVLYFGVLTPIALVARAFGHDALRRPRTAPSFWTDRPEPAPAEERASMQRPF